MLPVGNLTFKTRTEKLFSPCLSVIHPWVFMLSASRFHLERTRITKWNPSLRRNAINSAEGYQRSNSSRLFFSPSSSAVQHAFVPSPFHLFPLVLSLCCSIYILYPQYILELPPCFYRNLKVLKYSYLL